MLGSGTARAGAAPRAPLEHQPALDGLRGLAVLAVVLFHGGVSWAAGGYLGVSAFFTLSGFLITSVTLARRDATGGVDLVDFWRRRARRLLPAAWLCLAGIAVYGLTSAPASTVSNLPGDILAGLAYVANWRLIATGSSYDALFSAPSPVTHLWSLAIEEQFYLLFPLVAAVVLARGRSPRLLGVVLGLGAAASAMVTFALYEPGGSTARVYYGTDARSAEILIGAVAAVVWWEVRRSRPTPGPLSPLTSIAGAAMVVCGLVAWVAVDSTSSWLYSGGLVLHAVGVALLIVAVHHPGPLRRAFSVAPLRALGLISYGVYLYHWPLFLLLDETSTGLEGPALLAARLVVSVAVAALSYILVEEPIRNRRLRVEPRVALAAGLAVVLLSASVHVARPADDGSAFASPSVLPIDDVEGGGGGLADEGDGPPRVAFFGDSTSLRLSEGVVQRIAATEELQFGGRVTPLGCGLGRGGHRRYIGQQFPVECKDWEDTWPALHERRHIDISVVLVGPWEVVDRRLEGDEEWRAPGDPVYDEFLRSEVRTALSVLTGTSETVIWLTHPPIDPGRDRIPRPSETFPEADPDRMEHVNRIIGEEIERWPTDNVRLVDLAAHFDTFPGGPLDEDHRPDGVHLTVESAREVAGWLVPEILAVHGSVQRRST